MSTFCGYKTVDIFLGKFKRDENLTHLYLKNKKRYIKSVKMSLLPTVMYGLSNTSVK